MSYVTATMAESVTRGMKGVVPMEPDSARRAFLEMELERIKERVKRDWHAADYLRDELGQPPLPPLDSVFSGEVSSNGTAPQQYSPHAEPTELVNAGEFASRSSTKASKLLLLKVGRERPLKLAEIYAAIKKGGVQIGSAQTLWRSLSRSTEFCKPGRGLWALSEWYTPAELKRMEQRSATEGEAEAKELGLDAESDQSTTSPTEADSVGDVA